MAIYLWLPHVHEKALRYWIHLTKSIIISTPAALKIQFILEGRAPKTLGHTFPKHDTQREEYDLLIRDSTEEHIQMRIGERPLAGQF